MKQEGTRGERIWSIQIFRAAEGLLADAAVPCYGWGFNSRISAWILAGVHRPQGDT